MLSTTVTSPSRRSRSATDAAPTTTRVMLGRSGVSRPPPPVPTARTVMAGKPPGVAAAASRAAPVGVVRSPVRSPPARSPLAKFRPAAAAIRRTAGAGTGRRPCRLVTNPLPAASAEQHTTAPGRSSPRSSSAAADPTTSASESNAPTSWKCTSSGGSPCTAPSASASSRKTRVARSFPAGRRSLAPTCPSTSARCRSRSVTAGMVITARRHARPPRRAASVRSPRPGTPSEAIAPRTRSTSAPASSRAASSMSPATPAVASM